MTKISPKITLSDRAAREIKKFITEQDLSEETAGLRFGIRGGGCSGFEYTCDMVDKADKHDEIYEFDGARLFVDPKSLVFLGGTHVDYRTALMGAGFIFNNPNSVGECGCGTSFAV